MRASRSPLEAFRVILNGNVQKVLGVSLAEAEWDIRIAEPEQPDIRTFRASNYNLDLIWFLIPMFLFRRAFEKRFLEKIPWEVETNINRLAAQWEDRINAAIDGMQKQYLPGMSGTRRRRSNHCCPPPGDGRMNPAG